VLATAPVAERGTSTHDGRLPASMKLPLQITFRDLVPLPSLEGEIRRRAAKLEQFVPELMSCHVAVESTGNRHHQGHRYVVKIDVRVPGEELFVGEHHGDEDIAIALRDAFDAMTRSLENYAQRRRRQVKTHVPKPVRPPAEESARGEEEEGKSP
jgi:ribosome-associated translation inhibitor RaiA